MKEAHIKAALQLTRMRAERFHLQATGETDFNKRQMFLQAYQAYTSAADILSYAMQGATDHLAMFLQTDADERVFDEMLKEAAADV